MDKLLLVRNSLLLSPESFEEIYNFPMPAKDDQIVLYGIQNDACHFAEDFRELGFNNTKWLVGGYLFYMSKVHNWKIKDWKKWNKKSAFPLENFHPSYHGAMSWAINGVHPVSGNEEKNVFYANVQSE
jgi:hypothetical protein